MYRCLLAAAFLLALVALASFFWPVRPVVAVTEETRSGQFASGLPSGVPGHSVVAMPPAAGPESGTVVEVGAKVADKVTPVTVPAVAVAHSAVAPRASGNEGGLGKGPQTPGREVSNDAHPVDRRGPVNGPARTNPTAPSAVPAVPPLPRVVELEVPASTRLPLVLTETGEGMSDRQLSALDATAAAFVREVQPAPAPQPPARATPNPRQRWQQAQNIADERYRLLFGYQAADAAAVRSAAQER